MNCDDARDRESDGNTVRRCASGAVTGGLRFNNEVVARRDAREHITAVDCGCGRRDGVVRGVFERDRDVRQTVVASLRDAVAVEVTEHGAGYGRAGFGKVITSGLRADGQGDGAVHVVADGSADVAAAQDFGAVAEIRGLRLNDGVSAR